MNFFEIALFKTNTTNSNSNRLIVLQNDDIFRHHLSIGLG